MRLQAPHHGPNLIRAADGAEEAVSQRRLLVTDDALEKKKREGSKKREMVDSGNPQKQKNGAEREIFDGIGCGSEGRNI